MGATHTAAQAIAFAPSLPPAGQPWQSLEPDAPMSDATVILPIMLLA